MQNKQHIGSNFDDFLKEEGMLAHAEAVAIKRVIAYQLEVEMKRANVTKMEMAKKMRTSRSSLDRLLDPENASVSLLTLERAAVVLGRKLRIELA
ncbi:MAG: Fis family transcriptional regulator [Deltaproteobacteria bacterium]|nr:Fis family transcriptional regulator [Deltaproteobacteria bacterium]